MTNGFVWFHNHSAQPKETTAFYSRLLGWKSEDGPPGLTMFVGEKGPFAGLGAQNGEAGWLPFVEVADVDVATTRAVELGASVSTRTVESFRCRSRIARAGIAPRS
jgi:predicted enzyme related to lactoylglutathione lyase